MKKPDLRRLAHEHWHRQHMDAHPQERAELDPGLRQSMPLTRGASVQAEGVSEWQLRRRMYWRVSE